MNRLYSVIIAGLLIAAPLSAFADVKIFACEPEWESLAKEIGKDKVSIKTATSAFTDPHHIRSKPSLIAAIRRSDLVFCSGNSLEVGWLPILLEKAKESVQYGNVGYLMAGDHVKALEVPEVLDRSHGDVHPEGNPHVHLNPYNIAKIASELTKRLSDIDKENANFYQANLKSFSQKWDSSIKKWEAKAASLKGMPIVVHHKNWAYLIDWLGLKQVATLEPKPGIPPSASHLEKVITTLQETPAKAVIHAPYERHKPSNWLSEKASIPALKLAFTVGGNDKAVDLFSLYDDTISQLSEANK